jgi:hypothetical protein
MDKLEPRGPCLLILVKDREEAAALRPLFRV